MNSVKRGRRLALVGVVGSCFSYGEPGMRYRWVWPVYDFALRLPSPDGRYELVALRGDKATFCDFIHNLYVLPRSTGPQNLAPRTRSTRSGCLARGQVPRLFRIQLPDVQMDRTLFG